MSKLKYFPFSGQFDLRMGTVAFKENDRLVETNNEEYLHEINVKRQLLNQDHHYYYRSTPDTETAQWDVLEIVLNNLVTFEPQHFSLIRSGNKWHWQNRLLNETVDFIFGDSKTLPFEPLDWVGRQVQEDLVILSNDNLAALVAGQLCFANGWSINDKFGQPFLSIHAPAPKMIEPTMQTAQKLMERIFAERPVWRCSWNFKVWNNLDLSSKYNAAYNDALKIKAADLTAENIADNVYLRIERQTISRLPKSNNILFGIHMYQNSLENENMDKKQAANMLNVINTTPKEMLDYKAITPFKDALVTYLEKIVASD